MARVTYVDGIDTVRGALDSVKDGQANRARLVCKWHYWGEKWIDETGSKVHLVYTYHFHEGPWAEGATRNREMITPRSGWRTISNGYAITRMSLAKKISSKRGSGSRNTRSIEKPYRREVHATSTSTGGCSRRFTGW